MAYMIITTTVHLPYDTQTPLKGILYIPFLGEPQVLGICTKQVGPAPATLRRFVGAPRNMRMPLASQHLPEALN